MQLLIANITAKPKHVFPALFSFSWNRVTAQLHHQTIIWFRFKICIIFTKHLYLIWNNPHVSQPTTYELVCKPAQHYRPQFGHLIPLVFTEPRAALLVVHSGNEPSGENVCVFSFLPLSAGPGPAWRLAYRGPWLETNWARGHSSYGAGSMPRAVSRCSESWVSVRGRSLS